MQQTANLKLDKFEYADYADIPPVQGGNMDKIDVAIYNLQQSENTQGTDITNIKTDVSNLKDKVNSKPSTQMVLEAEESKSASIKISSLINPKYEGSFRQNLIDTRKCIYRMSGDTRSPLPTDITDSSMKVISNSTSHVGCGCFVGVVAGKEYSIKCKSVDSLDVHVYDADGLTTSNRASKRIRSQTNTIIDTKFTAPSSGYVFITFTKHGSDTSGTIVSNILMIEGDYTNKPIEWVKGTQPSIPSVNISGENLFDGNMELGFISSTTGLNQANTTYTRSVNYIRVKPNTSYKCTQHGVLKAVNVREYDINKDYIGSQALNAFTTSPNTGFIRFNYGTGYQDTEELKITESQNLNDYTPPKRSSFKLNEWLGDNEIYENGLVNKSWDRVLLSEAWDGTFYNASSDLGSVYRFYLNLKRNYSEHSIDTVAYSYFKDFTFKSDYESDFKHQYLISRISVNKNRFLIFIPKQEIDSLSGSSLTDKFEQWVLANDDYVYYKKSSSTTHLANASSIGGTFFGETNTFSNGSFGKATFDYQNSVMDSLNALSSSVNSLNTDQIVQDYTQKISDKIVVLKDQTIKQTDWVFDNFNGRYYLEFENELISPNKVVDVNFNISSYSNARVVLGITTSDYGKVMLYARVQPSADLAADIIIKEVD